MPTSYLLQSYLLLKRAALGYSKKLVSVTGANCSADVSDLTEQVKQGAVAQTALVKLSLTSLFNDILCK
jgi:hypothetical protein